jgi:hypothetical protein
MNKKDAKDAIVTIVLVAVGVVLGTMAMNRLGFIQKIVVGGA